MKTNLVKIFFKAAEKHPQNTAIVHDQQKISYQALKIEVESTAAWLTEKGINEHSKVLVFIPMSIKLYQTVLALFSIGATVVFVDEWSDRSRLKKALSVVPIDAILAPRKFLWLAYILNPFRKIPLKLSIPNKLKKKEFKYLNFDPNKTALITFTTGSTGLPKAADRTHQFLKEQFRILEKEIGATAQDQCLITLPIVLLSILGTGATGYVALFNHKKPEKLDAKKQVELLVKNKISLLIASPFYVERLAEVTNNQSGIRKIITGGAPVFPPMAKKINQAFPNSVNLIAYGSTEAEPISSINMSTVEHAGELLSQGLPVGQLHPEIQLHIIKISAKPITIDDGNWSELDVLSGEIGEIIVAGPHVLTSYYNSEEAFKENKIVDGNTIWHRTGDSGRMIGDSLFLNGRCNQLIQKNGKYISPFVIENQLLSIPGIQMGTMILSENQLILIIEKSKEASEEVIRKALVSVIKEYDQVIFLEEIPRDPRHFSKIDYGKLRELI